MGATHKSVARRSILPLAPCVWLQSNFLINGCAQIHCLAAEISVCPNPAACGVLPKENSTRIDRIYTPLEINFLSSQALKSKAEGRKNPTVPWEDCTLTGFTWSQSLGIDAGLLEYAGQHIAATTPPYELLKVQRTPLSAVILVTCVMWCGTEWCPVISALTGRKGVSI